MLEDALFYVGAVLMGVGGILTLTKWRWTSTLAVSLGLTLVGTSSLLRSLHNRDVFVGVTCYSLAFLIIIAEAFWEWTEKKRARKEVEQR